MQLDVSQPTVTHGLFTVFTHLLAVHYTTHLKICMGVTGMSELEKKSIRLAQNETNLEILKMSSQYILARRTKMFGKRILKKSGYGSFRAKLIQLYLKYDAPGF